MAEKVQNSVFEATKYVNEPGRALVSVTIWNAQRNLLDDTIGWIESVMAERDRIVAEYRGREDGQHDHDTN